MRVINKTNPTSESTVPIRVFVGVVCVIAGFILLEMLIGGWSLLAGVVIYVLFVLYDRRRAQTSIPSSPEQRL